MHIAFGVFAGSARKTDDRRARVTTLQLCDDSTVGADTQVAIAPAGALLAIVLLLEVGASDKAC